MTSKKNGIAFFSKNIDDLLSQKDDNYMSESLELENYDPYLIEDDTTNEVSCENILPKNICELSGFKNGLKDGKENDWPGTSDTFALYPENDNYKNNDNYQQLMTNKLSGISSKYNFVMNNEISEVHNCKKTDNFVLSDLQPYQRIPGYIINNNSPYRGILIFHGLGSGKSLSFLFLLKSFLQEKTNRTCFIVGKPSLKQNTFKDVDKMSDLLLFGEKLDFEERKHRISKSIIYITFEELANRLSGITQWNFEFNKEIDKQSKGCGSLKFGTKQADSKKTPLLNGTLIIIDEAHNMVKQLNKPKYPSEDAANVLINSINNATDCKVVLLTATPIQQRPYEIGILLNMLKPTESKTRFPEVFIEKNYRGYNFLAIDHLKTEEEFNKLFINQVTNEIINKDLFHEMCKGLISYYPVEFNKRQFAQRIDEETIYVPMSTLQYEKYEKIRREEIKSQNGANCFIGNIDNKNSEDDNDDLDDQKTLHKGCFRSLRASDFISHSRNDIDNIIKNNQENIYSPKFCAIVQLIINNIKLGKQAVFSSTGDLGLYFLKKLLEKNNFVCYTSDYLASIFPKESLNEINITKLNKRNAFVIFNNEETSAVHKIKTILSIYNDKLNTKGEFINVILLNNKFTEGISLLSIRSIILTQVPPSKALEDQIIGRTIRLCSHQNLPYPKDWNVHVYRFQSTYENLHTFNKQKYLKNDSMESKKRLDQNMKNDKITFNNFVMGGDTYDNNLKEESIKSMKVKKKKNSSNFNSFCNDLNENECTKLHYCDYDLKDNKCKFLNTESTIDKLATQNNEMIELFSNLLISSAIDCTIFKKMHDPNKKLECYRSKLIQNKKNIKIKSEKSIQKNNVKQYINKNCDKIYNEDECNSNPMCQYSTDDTIFSFKKKCKNRYDEELNKMDNCISFELNSTYKTLTIFNLTLHEVSIDKEQIVKKQFWSDQVNIFINLLHQKKNIKSINIIRFLNSLLDNATTYNFKIDENKLHEIASFVQKNNTEAVNKNEYEVINFLTKKMILNKQETNKQSSEQHSNKKYIHVINYFNSNLNINLTNLKKKSMNNLHYTFHVTFQHSNIYISSHDNDKLPIDLNNRIESIESITKEFSLSNLHFAIQFYLKENELKETIIYYININLTKKVNKMKDSLIILTIIKRINNDMSDIIY